MKVEKAPVLKRLLALDFDILLLLNLMFGLYIVTGIHFHLPLFVFVPLVIGFLLLRDSFGGQSPGKRLFGIGVREKGDLERKPSAVQSLLYHISLGKANNTEVYVRKQVNFIVAGLLFLLLLAVLIVILFHFPLDRFLANEFCCSNDAVVTRF